MMNDADTINGQILFINSNGPKRQSGRRLNGKNPSAASAIIPLRDSGNPLPICKVVERERENSKTLFYKDCSLGSVKNLTTSPC